MNGYRSNRERMAEERKKQSIIDNVQAQSEILRKIRSQQIEQKAENKLLFCLWYMLDKRIEELEDIRKQNEPKHPDDEWNEAFCYAIEKLPELEQLCEDICFEYLNCDRPEFRDLV